MDSKDKEQGTSQLIGIVHPGMRGVFVVASMVASGYAVCWASEGRSPAAGERVEEYVSIFAWW